MYSQKIKNYNFENLDWNFGFVTQTKLYLKL